MILKSNPLANCIIITSGRGKRKKREKKRKMRKREKGEKRTEKERGMTVIARAVATVTATVKMNARMKDQKRVLRKKRNKMKGTETPTKKVYLTLCLVYMCTLNWKLIYCHERSKWPNNRAYIGAKRRKWRERQRQKKRTVQIKIEGERKKKTK